LVNEKDDLLLLRFSVEDSGIGIPIEKQETIFESFTQAFTDTTRRFGGTGLGLAITKNLVVLQGGTITLHSIPDKGTTFIIEIPFKKSTAVFTRNANIPSTNNRNLSGAFVLIVEDNMMNQFVVKQIMGKWNANMVIANNGSEAIELLKEHNFDIVLMDLQMPEMSGYQAAEYIRSKNSSVKNPSIPIIALSADAFAETKRKVFEAGMNDFITKPFSQEELYSKMTKHLP
jgi:CheY-like chemotaxis protein